MKKIIKTIYMFIFHPLIAFRTPINKFLFIKRRANIKHYKRIQLGKNISIGTDVRINFFNHDLDKSLYLGDNVYICNRDSFIIGGKITIGSDTIIASDVAIISENHSINPVHNLSYKDQDIICSDVKIGKGCWLGEKVIVLPGVEIGDKVVIGAGSVVTKSIPSYCIAVGNPAKVIKTYNFESNKWDGVLNEK